MSKSIRTEEQRRIAELESLVAGLSEFIVGLEKALDECKKKQIELVLALGKEKKSR